MKVRMFLALAIASGFIIVMTPSKARADPPPPVGPCSTAEDPSGLCPPNESEYINAYAWAYNGGHGGSSVDFGSGPALPSSFSAFQSSCPVDPVGTTYAGDYSACSVPSPNEISTDAPNSEDSWFSTNQVTVGGGELHLGTGWDSGIKDCNDYWGYVVGIDGGPNGPASGCWPTGTVSQQPSVWPLPTGPNEHFAFQAKWVGTADLPHLDSTFQASSDFPPEVDVVETDTPGSSFTSFIHCAPSNTQDQEATSVDMTTWNTYEFDFTSTDAYIYDDGTLEWTLAKSGSHCTGDSGQTSSDWLPYTPTSHDLCAYMEAVMGTDKSFPGSAWHGDTQSILVDWIAEDS